MVLLLEVLYLKLFLLALKSPLKLTFVVPCDEVPLVDSCKDSMVVAGREQNKPDVIIYKVEGKNTSEQIVHHAQYTVSFCYNLIFQSFMTFLWIKYFIHEFMF